MPRPLALVLNVVGRVLLCAIFLLSALTQKIPHFSAVAKDMESRGIPAPQLMLAGAIAFVLLGCASILFGYYSRVGALLLLIFLAAASYYFHNFWTLREGPEKMQQQIHFMKNVALMGAMLLIMANGVGYPSLDARAGRPQTP